MDASAYPGSGDVTLDLTLSHYAPSGESALDIPFRGLPKGNQVTIRNLPAPPPPSPPPPSIPPMSPPPSPPPPMSPPPPPQTPVCTSVALLLINNQERQDYSSGFWATESTVGDWNPNDCEEAYSWGNSDVKTEAYWSRPIGTQITLVARGDEGVFLGKAVYAVLPEYQGMTLKQLLTGPADIIFTSMKDTALSSGDLRSTFKQGSHGGGVGTDHSKLGDMFIDFDNALVANSRSGFGSDRNHNRLTTTYGKAASWSNGHVFGGLGGSHVESGWGADYESQPVSPYCDIHNMYGSASGNVVSNGQVSMPFQSNCYGENNGISHKVDFGIYVDAAEAVEEIS